MAQHEHSHHPPDLDWAAMVEFAEAEGEVLLPFLTETASLLAGMCDREGLEVRRIVDVGCGPGVGSCVLAQRFAPATVVAADGSAEMLANVEARARRLGLWDRMETRVLELPDGLPALGQADLVWASMVLHHVGDEAAGLRGLRAVLRPGHLLALVEFGDPLRLLPEDVDLGRPGLWERLDAARAAWLADMRAGLPGAAPSAEYQTMLEAAGFEVLVDRVVPVHVGPPLDARARELAHRHLGNLRPRLEPYADPADLEALEVLADGEGAAGILGRDDAVYHASRRLLVARAAHG
jgi:SAM-dependent methyltransferase